MTFHKVTEDKYLFRFVLHAFVQIDYIPIFTIFVYITVLLLLLCIAFIFQLILFACAFLSLSVFFCSIDAFYII